MSLIVLHFGSSTSQSMWCMFCDTGLRSKGLFRYVRKSMNFHDSLGFIIGTKFGEKYYIGLTLNYYCLGKHDAPL